MMPAGDDVQERARPDNVGDTDNEIRENQEYNGIGDRCPEALMKRIGRIPGDDVAQLEEKHRDNDRRVDSASHHQVGRE
jgi:hypothetical protein